MSGFTYYKYSGFLKHTFHVFSAFVQFSTSNIRISKVYFSRYCSYLFYFSAIWRSVSSLRTPALPPHVAALSTWEIKKTCNRVVRQGKKRDCVVTAVNVNLTLRKIAHAIHRDCFSFKNVKFQQKNVDIFLSFAQNRDCVYT